MGVEGSDSGRAVCGEGEVRGSRPLASLRYPGAKWSVAERVVTCFGPHYRYVEPFFGSGAVFFAKPPSPHEVLNDVDGRVVNPFRVIRDRCDDLCWALEATPWARDEYDISAAGLD